MYRGGVGMSRVMGGHVKGNRWVCPGGQVDMSRGMGGYVQGVGMSRGMAGYLQVGISRWVDPGGGNVRGTGGLIRGGGYVQDASYINAFLF